MNFHSIFSKTDKSVSKVTFNSDDIAAFIQNFDPNRAHDHNKLSICMLKLISKTICKLSALIFHFYIKHGEFAIESRKKMLFLSMKKLANRSQQNIE